MLLTNTYPENKKKLSCFQGVKRNIPKMLQIVPRMIPDISY